MSGKAQWGARWVGVAALAVAGSWALSVALQAIHGAVLLGRRR